MDSKKAFALSTCAYLILSGTVGAAPATSTVRELSELIASGGVVDVINQYGIAAQDKIDFVYAGDVNITQTINSASTNKRSAISIFNSIMRLGKTDILVNYDSGTTGYDVMPAVVLGHGSSSLPGPSRTVTAEFGAGSSITINGNNRLELYGVLVEGGTYLDNGVTLVPSMAAYLNENTIITLNNAGYSSTGLSTYLSGTKIEAKDGLVVNVNSGINATIYGIRADGLASRPEDKSEIKLQGAATVNMVNGGSGTTGILANIEGSVITSSGHVAVSNTTTASNASLYGIRAASKGVINFSGLTSVTLEGGDSGSSAVLASSGGKVTLTGAMINNSGNGNALRATDQGSTLTGNAAQYDITGSILSSSGGIINLSMADGSTFTGSSLLGATPGTTNLTLSGANSIWDMTGDSALTDLTLDGATLKYSDTSGHSGSPMVAKTLTVNGNYTSNNGTLVLNSVLGDDASLSDKLVVNGDTAGHTNVVINNLGGQGAQTIQGIEIVQVGGNSLGTFDNSARIVAGAFDYFVRSGSTIAGADAKNWYLVSDITPVDPGGPEDPEDPGDPSDPGDPGGPGDPEGPGVVVTPAYRPEAGSYLANLAAANTLFITSLHDRLGETQYTDALTG